MKTQQYKINDVLLITRKGEEALAQVAKGRPDGTKPFHCHLRVTGGLRWSSNTVKVDPSQIVKHLPNWYAEQKAKFDDNLKEFADRTYAKMTPEQKARLKQETEWRRNRSPLDIVIDRACGME